MSLHTFILDDRGGTYISQMTANNLTTAINNWEHQLRDEDLTVWKLKREEIQSLLERHPVPLESLKNVWCLSAATANHLVLLNIVLTIAEP